jgi:hypothetical protein
MKRRLLRCKVFCLTWFIVLCVVIAVCADSAVGAGYGVGATLQARADDIYADLVVWQQGVQGAGSTGKALGGWIDTAVTWWLGSTNNTWATTLTFQQIKYSTM